MPQSARSHLVGNGAPIDLAHEQTYSLGAVKIIPPLRRLTGNEGTSQLEPKVMQVLVALARKSGSILSRDDLIECCWNGHIVGDASINRVMSILRSALRDCAGDAVTIETVPRVGYRLLVPIKDESARRDRDYGDLALHSSSFNRRGRWLVVVAVLLGAIAAMAPWPIREIVRAKPVDVAVIPLKAASPSEELFALGFSGQIRQALAEGTDVRVTRSASAESLYSEGINPREIGMRLGVDAVLLGAVQRQGDRISVELMLQHTEEGGGVWRQKFQSSTLHSHALPTRASTALRQHLELAVQDAPPSPHIDGSSFASFVEAEGMIRTRDAEQIERAQRILRAILQEHPRFAEGHAALAKASYLGAWLTNEGDSADGSGLLRAQRHAQRALKLAPHSAEALSAAGLIAKDPAVARRYLRRAVQIDPGRAESWQWLANAEVRMGLEASALQSLQMVVQLDPLWSRARIAPDAAASLGDIALADRLDLAIRAAAGDGGWQATLADARIARRRGNSSEYVRLLQDALFSAPPSEHSELARDLMLVRANLGLEVRPLSDDPIWMLGYHLLRGTLPPRSGWNTDPKLFFELPTISAAGPPLFLASGRGEELLALYDKAYGSPVRLLNSNSESAEMAASTAPYVALALRQAGREREARELLVRAQQAANPRAGEPMPVERIILLARVAAVSGQEDRAISRLREARARGWPHSAVVQSLPMKGRLFADPAFVALANDRRFRAIASEVEFERAREAREAIQGNELS